MKMKKVILSLFVIIMIIILGVGQNISLATSTKQKLYLSYAKYITDGNNMNEKGTYALNNNHCIFQIRELGNDFANNYYCLDAETSYTWNYHRDSQIGMETANVTTPVEYDSYYDMVSESNTIKNLTSEAYKRINNSEYLGQILWILDNMYISKEDNDEERIALLAKAGIKETKIYAYFDSLKYMSSRTVYAYTPEGYEEFVEYVENEENGIKYKVGNEERYNSTKLSRLMNDLEDSYPDWTTAGTYMHTYSLNAQSFTYIDSNNNIVNCDLPSDIVEAVEQAAIWYYTEYKIKGNENYNYYTKSSISEWLKYSLKSGTSRSYDSISNYLVDPSDGSIHHRTASEARGCDYEIGAMYQEQACLLYNYLIDGAEEANKENNYAEQSEEVPIVSNTITSINKVETNYIVGPINITKVSELPYILNSMQVTDQNRNTISNWKVSDKEGNEFSVSDYSTLVGKEGGFYIKVPSKGINTVNIKIEGTYQTTQKRLLVVEASSNTEQLIVEINETNKPIELNVIATINKNFDLALRKAIVAINGKKTFYNEDGNIATRINSQNIIDYNTASIATNLTATYNHRKDPVVVKKGDIVTYQLTVYNEGDKDGYVTKIVDKLPDGLKLQENQTQFTTTNGVTYEYNYNSETNEIIITKNSESTYILEAYNGGDNLNFETIEIKCEVTQNPSNVNYTYLTNIAYIAEEYDSEDNITITNEVGKDRDSEPSNYPTSELTTTSSTKKSYNGYKGNTNNGSVYGNGSYYYKGQQDDDDFEVLVIDPEQFDLKLVKFISAVNNDNTKGRNVTSINSSNLLAGIQTTAEYELSKDPIKVKTGDYVTYTLRIYNEGDISGYAEEITEDIPEGLEFVYDNGITINTNGEVDYSNCSSDLSEEDKKLIEFNLIQGWSLKTTDSNNKITMIKSDLLSKNKTTTNLIKSFDKETDNGNGSGLSYKEIKIMLKVTATNTSIGIIRNEAEISNDKDFNGNDIIDRDSEPENWVKYQDDEDYDNIMLEEFDLALRKYIVAISDDINIKEGEYLSKDRTSQTEYSREPIVDTSKLKTSEETTAIYNHSKDVLTVARENYILYTIRVYNEGDIDGYASKITDHLPTYLDYVECEFNDKYNWEVASDGKTVSTTYLSSEKSTENKLKAFNSANDDGNGSGLDYKDIQILCKVNKNAIPMKNITNIAEIDEYQDKDGVVIPKDRDSKSDNLTDDILDQECRSEYNGGLDKDITDNYIPGQEDDDDFERIIVREFDLALLKYVSEVHVIENGEEQIIKTGNTGNNSTDIIPKVEIYRKSINSITVKFVYTIKITNEGDIAGFANEITDYVPEGLKFYEEDNTEWVDEGNNVISTKQTRSKLLNPGESTTVDVTFRWINGSENLGTKINYAEISEDYNEWSVEDRDSTPDNKVMEEDDIDYAKVLLSISTGLKENIILYITVGGVLLTVLALGIILIKKYVL